MIGGRSRFLGFTGVSYRGQMGVLVLQPAAHFELNVLCFFRIYTEFLPSSKVYIMSSFIYEIFDKFKGEFLSKNLIAFLLNFLAFDTIIFSRITFR